MDYGLIGKRLNYSFSKDIHEMLGEYSYTLCEVAPENFESFMKARDFKGCNVTIPYKEEVMAYLDEIDAPAERIGAVNTIYFKDGKLHGTNTDYLGFLWMAERAGVSFAGKKVLVAGTGGAGKMAVKAAEDSGAKEVLLAGRKGPVPYEEIPEDIEVFVNATPVGTYPNNGAKLLELSRFTKLEGVLDLIYNPAKTALLLEAEALGLKFSDGLPMLVAQATAAAEFFTGKEGFPNENDRILKALRRQTRNISLVGMPGCGKSTIGKQLAEALGMKFVDSDTEFQAYAGETPATVISRDGEQSFRDTEAKVIATITKEHGQVIATGGGAILREENRLALRQNGPVIFIDRPTELLATQGRPLSKNLEDLQKKRLPLYLSCSDITVKNFDNFKETTKTILAMDEFKQD